MKTGKEQLWNKYNSFRKPFGVSEIKKLFRIISIV